MKIWSQFLPKISLTDDWRKFGKKLDVFTLFRDIWKSIKFCAKPPRLTVPKKCFDKKRENLGNVPVHWNIDVPSPVRFFHGTISQKFYLDFSPPCPGKKYKFHLQFSYSYPGLFENLWRENIFYRNLIFPPKIENC
jgi:hypothetical protein